ncbi:MAG: formate dehydrogenase subunit delta [Dongiaceae bacterium]
MKTERLVHMANQIADFFAAYPREEAVAGVADHLKKFWDPRMRTALVAHVKAGGAGLRDLVTAAVAKMEAPPG